MVSTENPTDSRAWVRELERAGVLVHTESIDSNGNVIFRMGQFPAGVEGERLRALFDRHVEQAR
jgi:hypothetical protein